MTTLSQECQPLTERFGARGAVVPQKILCEIERLSPAGNLVEAPPAPSRHPVVRQRRERCRKCTGTENEVHWDNVADKRHERKNWNLII